MIGIQLAAICGAMVAGRIALRHDHPVELVMACYFIAAAIAVEIST